MRKQKGRIHCLPCALAVAYLLSLLIVLPRADAAGLGVSSAGGTSTSAVSPESGQASGGETASVGSTPVSAASSEAGQNSGSGQTPGSSSPSSAVSSPAGQASGSELTSSDSSCASAVSSGTAQNSCDSSAASGVQPGYRYEDDDVVVTAVPSDASKMPEDALFCVTPVTEQSDGARFLKIENSVEESLQSGNRDMTGLRAYDITFTEKGKTIEPGAVAVTVLFKHGIFDQNVKKSTKEIKVFGLKETAAGTQIGGDVTATAKLAAKAQDIASAADTIRFVTGGLSLFAVTGVGAAVVKTEKQFSDDEIRSGLSPVLPYAVFANYFRLTSDMDGCIAASSADIGADFGNSDDNFKTYRKDSNTVTVEKIYSGSTGKTFRFGLYGGSQIGDFQSITLPAGKKNSGNTVFHVDNGNVEKMTVKELDSDGKPVTGDDPLDGFTLISSTHEKKPTNLTTMNCTSYIDSMKVVYSEDKKDVSYQMNSTTLPNPPNRLIVGSGCNVDNDGHVTSGGTYNCYGSANLDQVPPEQEFPINFKKTLNSLADFSIKLAQASSSGTVMVENLTVDELNSADGKINPGNKMLLLNIDATGHGSFKIPAQFKLTVNGEACSNWAKSAANVVVNVYTRDGSVLNAYGGKISDIGYVMGIFLAPLATITDTGAPFNGNIVADRIEYAPSEIHGVGGGFRGDNITWSFENQEYTPIVLPQTGGPGTSGFFAAGVGLFLLAAALLLFRRVLRMCRFSASAGRLCLCGCRAPPLSGRKGVKVPSADGSP